ncbi:MAG: bifunctional nuclease family protein, partial [Candidatus Kapabacteria bacterium]|nr:bifunctional nuclease family protein [Candidatus Kapabacteria bacterium]
SRPSDAIAIALRFNAPIYIAENLLDEAGFSPEELEGVVESQESSEKEIEVEKSTPRTRREILEEYLLRAIEQEEYEKAAQIRDEIEKLNHE